MKRIYKAQASFMHTTFRDCILQSTGAQSFHIKEVIQELWSGYGQLMIVELAGAPIPEVIVKHIQTPKENSHPRGWNSNLGHQRKLKSYQVESQWYENYSAQSQARLPHCYTTAQHEAESLIVLENLNLAGFRLRKEEINWLEIKNCLSWLAQFHASYLGEEPRGLWENGTYWHLDTRPQELEKLEDQALKEAAPEIDARLNNCKFKTLVHGDAKLANFCFAPDGSVAGVDFQYVGGGCGMKDVAYFVGSCLDEKDCERLEAPILDHYFQALHAALGTKNEALEQEWRTLYHWAWVDFHRFLKGWSPGHWKINSYSESLCRKVLKEL